MKDKIDNNELEVKHRWTDVMWSDVLNKPKQGTPFRAFHGALMNVSENYDDDEGKNTHNTLLPQEGDGVVDATLFKHTTGVMMNKKHEHIFHQKSVLDESLFGDSQKLRTGTSRSINIINDYVQVQS